MNMNCQDKSSLPFTAVSSLTGFRGSCYIVFLLPPNIDPLLQNINATFLCGVWVLCTSRTVLVLSLKVSSFLPCINQATRWLELCLKLFKTRHNFVGRNIRNKVPTLMLKTGLEFSTFSIVCIPNQKKGESCAIFSLPITACLNVFSSVDGWNTEHWNNIHNQRTPPLVEQSIRISTTNMITFTRM